MLAVYGCFPLKVFFCFARSVCKGTYMRTHIVFHSYKPLGYFFCFITLSKCECIIGVVDILFMVVSHRKSCSVFARSVYKGTYMRTAQYSSHVNRQVALLNLFGVNAQVSLGVSASSCRHSFTWSLSKCCKYEFIFLFMALKLLDALLALQFCC